jgi:hypothetical protein
MLSTSIEAEQKEESFPKLRCGISVRYSFVNPSGFTLSVFIKA